MHPITAARRLSAGRSRPRCAVAATVSALCVTLTIGQPIESAEARTVEVAASSMGPSPDDVASVMASTLRLAETVARAVPSQPPSLRAPTTQARWQWPLPTPEMVLAPFDGPAQRWLPGHRGVDLAGFDSAPVRVVADGTVSFSGVINGVGVISVVHPDGTLSTYQPVLNTSGKGKQVRAGDLIGTLATKGSHCWPLTCLHLGARRGKQYLDPMMFLRPWIVSLLPPSR